MTIQVICECGRNYDIAEENAGKSFACKACGQKLTVPAAEQDSYEATLAWVQEQREAGQTRGALREGLIEHGYSDDEAHAVVDEALGATGRSGSRRGRDTASAGGGGDGDGYGWLLGVGGLVLFNVLSWMFDWPIWIW